MRRFFRWLLDRLIVTERPAPSFEARAITTRVGDKTSDGFSKWKVVFQLSSPTADFDAVYTIGWLSKDPPNAAEMLRYFDVRPQDFTFLDFVPNLNKQPPDR
jgi:hypothetical protein